mmetsp:Transcript_17217/g.35951  ORF Transcript_17217/g.35951 Transcript_17217/m.35951 type:complete len:388 (-) Transcript_17217:171-1334(-)
MSTSKGKDKKGVTGRLWFRVVALVGLVISISIGWLLSHEIPIGVLFATIIPIMGKKLPPSIFGHGRMNGTPKVPHDLMPRPRPEREMFLDLPGGFRMPQNGLGMCCRATAYDDILVYRTVLWYLLQGGRHIDGAHLYLNHQAIGKGIAEAVRRGVPRSEIFVTTKIFPTHFGFESSKGMIDTYLKQLGLDYIDLVLLHFPSIPLASSPCKKGGSDETECRRETWTGLSEMRENGYVRNIGVSNFSVRHLMELEGIGAPIANNQIAFNPFVPDEIMETISYCKTKNITVTAHSPLGGIADKDKAMLHRVLNGISSNHDKKVSQIMLRWAMQLGFAVIPGTGNPNHMVENLGIYGFELEKNEMDAIDGLKYNAEGFSAGQTTSFIGSLK